MGYAGDAMNEPHGTDVFTEERRTTQPETNWRRELEQRGQALADAMGRYRGTEPLVEAVARLSNDYHDLAVRDAVLNEVGAELAKARATHAPMNGHHEGYAVMLEEMDELWVECKSNTHAKSTPESERPALRQQKKSRMRKEALQIAAMAVRFIEDVCDKPSALGGL